MSLPKVKAEVDPLTDLPLDPLIEDHTADRMAVLTIDMVVTTITIVAMAEAAILVVSLFWV